MRREVYTFRHQNEILITSTVRDTFCFSRATRSFNYRLAGFLFGEER